MPKKIITGEFEGDEVSVENTWLGGAKLFHNQKLIASNSKMLAINENEPVMATKIVIKDVERLVEVYALAVFTVKLQIQIDGVRIAGVEF